MAKNLSALKATTPKNEAKAIKFAVIRFAMDMELIVGLFPVQVSCFDPMTRQAMYKGWTIKPTPRSETARLRSNVFKGFANELVFLIACIVTMFNTMAAYNEKALNTQLAMYFE